MKKTISPPPASPPRKELFRISLAEWSLHRALRSGRMTNLDFPIEARNRFGLDAVEYVNVFFKDEVRDAAYVRTLRRVCDEHGVKSLLIMCDGEGALGDPDEGRRQRAVENHFKWLDAAAVLGCHSIRVNAQSEGTWEEQAARASDGLFRLAEAGASRGISVIVENHGGLSSNGRWLREVMERTAHPWCGTLPDFGNFCMDWSRAHDPTVWYDRYLGVEELMPFARGVSAKSHDFNDAGEETSTDYDRMMRIVLESGYRGYVGIEYEGNRLSEHEGIAATKRLLEHVRLRLREEFSDS